MTAHAGEAGRGGATRRGAETRRAVVLAGGRGRRLAPYTTVLPKPLMPVGDRSILDIVLRRLGAAGFDDVTLAVGHLSHLICAVVGDGSGHGVRLRYHHESEPLGTAGPLASIPDLDGTFLMLNGDVLTTLDLRALVRAHEQAGNHLTIATHRRIVRADYGVLGTDGAEAATHRVVTYDEKPELAYTVSMGIYVVEPEAVEHVPAGRYYDLPDLVQALLAAGAPVGSYAFDGPWLDIGREDDYRRAQEQAEVWQP